MNDDLVARARTGDEKALRALYERSRPRILRLAYSLLGDADEAEDIMQDVMVYALTHLNRYEPDRAAFDTWLHTLAVNRCRDRMRRHRLSVRRVADWLRSNTHVAEPGPDARAENMDAADQVATGLRGLTPLQREALVLREVEGLTFADMSQVLGVPLRTAQARVTSAHAAMRRSLQIGAAAEKDRDDE